MNVREFKDAQKTLISFCIQVPIVGSKESIFKNSRLMLHEIVDKETQDVEEEKAQDDDCCDYI